MNTVADGLASLSFHQGKRKKRRRKKKKKDRKRVKRKRTVFNNSKVLLFKSTSLNRNLQ